MKTKPRKSKMRQKVGLQQLALKVISIWVDWILYRKSDFIDQSLHRPAKVLDSDLGPGKLLEFEKNAIYPGIVLEFCKIAIETVKSSLKIIKYINSFGFMCCAKENCVKIAGYV